MEEDDDPPVDDDFELDLEAVDVVSSAFAVVSLDFNAVASDSILVATAPGNAGGRWCFFNPFLFLVRGGISRICRVHVNSLFNKTQPNYM